MKKLSDLQGQNIVVFDLEIKNVIDGKNVTWKTKDKMGISVGCLFDYRTGDSHVYLDDNILEIVNRINDADLVVGFNILDFDIPLLNATLPYEVNHSRVYDILKEVRRSTGSPFPKGCNLNEVLAATFGMQKTEDGANAPIFYQEGKMGKLISYCLADVRRERLAFEYAYLNGHLKTATHGIHAMRCPLEILNSNKKEQSL